MPVVQVITEADFDRNGSYETDLSAYVTSRSGGLGISRGMGMNAEARPGTLSARLDNFDGAFTPEYSSSPLYGQLEPTVPIRVRCVHNSIEYVPYTGYVVKFSNSFGVVGENRAYLEARDLSHFLAESDLVNVTVSTTRDTDGALVAIMDALGLTSADRDFDDGVQALPLHYCLAQNAFDAMQQVVRSEMGGAFFVNGDGQLAFHSRSHRLGTDVAQSWGNDVAVQPERVEYELRDTDYVTAVRARATVFRTGQADIEIFRFSRSMDTRPDPDSMQLAAGEVYTRDFDTQSAVVSITAPEASIDYQANDAIDGSGTDRTSLLDVTVVDRGAGRFNLRLENTHASAIYVTRFRLRGQPTNFFADRPEAYFSLSVPGRKAGKVVELDIPFGGDGGHTMRDYAYATLRTYRYVYPVVKLHFAWDSDAIAVAMLTAELGDLIWFDDTATSAQGAQWLTNVKDWFYIEAIDHQMLPGEVFRTAITLTPSYLSRNLAAIAFDTFDRANASGDLGTSFSGDTWANDTGFDIVSNAARANSTGLQTPNVAVTA